LRPGGSSSSSYVVVIPGGGGSAGTIKLFTRWPTEPRTKVEIDKNWLAGAELVRFEWKVVKTWPVSVDVKPGPR
jgi:hypothetical protein